MTDAQKEAFLGIIADVQTLGSKAAALVPTFDAVDYASHLGGADAASSADVEAFIATLNDVVARAPGIVATLQSVVNIG